MKVLTVLLSAAAIFSAAGAQAQTYTETLDLPAYGSTGPRVLQSTSSFTTGVKLTGADEVSNPSGWANGFDVSLDTVAKTITLTGDGFNDYQTIFVDIAGITGLDITGLTAIDAYGATGNAGYSYGNSLSFTGSTLHIGFSADDVAGGGYFDITRGSSVFSYTTGAATGAVPEPATWAMMLAGFGMVGLAARRRSSVKTTVSYA